MNTNHPPSDTPEEPDFNGFGSYRRNRKERGPGNDAPRRSFRRIPRDEFQERAADSEPAGEAPEAGEAAPRRPFRKFGGGKPFGKKPFGKKPFVKKKPFDGADSEADRPSFRDFADTIDEGDVPPPHRDRSFKNAGGFSRGEDGGFHRARKPFGGKPHGKKPSGKFRPFRKEPPFGEDGNGEAPRPPRAIRRPYGMGGDEIPFEEETPAPPHNPFRKPFGKKPFGKKPFGKKPFHARKPFGTPPSDMAPDDVPASFAKKPFGKKPFGKKPFGKGKPFGKKPFGRKPFGKGKPFGKKPFGPKRPPRG